MASFSGTKINPSKLHISQWKFFIILIPVAIFMVLPIVYIINHAFKPIDEFVNTLGVDANDFNSWIKYQEFKDLFLRLILNMYLAWTGIRIVYFTLVPAIIGSGRTVGRLVAGIGILDCDTLEEISPSKLILREVVGRVVVETILIIPGLISIIMPFVRKDQRTIRDLIANTNAIKLDLYHME
jgi:hypothetical protein